MTNNKKLEEADEALTDQEVIFVEELSREFNCSQLEALLLARYLLFTFFDSCDEHLRQRIEKFLKDHRSGVVYKFPKE